MLGTQASLDLLSMLFWPPWIFTAGPAQPTGNIAARRGAVTLRAHLWRSVQLPLQFFLGMENFDHPLQATRSLTRSKQL